MYVKKRRKNFDSFKIETTIEMHAFAYVKLRIQSQSKSRKKCPFEFEKRNKNKKIVFRATICAAREKNITGMTGVLVFFLFALQFLEKNRSFFFFSLSCNRVL